MLIKNCSFSLEFCDFSELCQFCCSAGFLPAQCVYTHLHRGKTEAGIFLKIRNKTQYIMNTLYLPCFGKLSYLCKMMVIDQPSPALVSSILLYQHFLFVNCLTERQKKIQKFSIKSSIVFHSFWAGSNLYGLNCPSGYAITVSHASGHLSFRQHIQGVH